MSTPLTIPALLHRSADQFGSATYLVSTNGAATDRLTYRQAEQVSADAARQLLAIGVGKGTRVGVFFSNGTDWIVWWLAASRIGAVVVPLSTMYRPAELAKVLRLADITVLVSGARVLDSEVPEMLEAALPELADQSAGRLRLVAAPFLRTIVLTEPTDRTWASTPGDPDDVPAALDYSLPEFDLRLAFEPVDFIQVNAEVNRALVSRAVQWLDAGPTDRVLDLFCGLGNFTLALARRAGTVVGVEGDAGLIARARGNAGRNGIANAAFHVGNLAAEDLALERWWAGGFTHVLLDPPRVGARDVLAPVAQLAPKRIVYVSCHPGTLARDLGILVHEHGYGLVAAGVLDMFPHTTHVESMAVLEPIHDTCRP